MTTAGIHILVVDDLEENRFVLKRMLRKSEFKGKFTLADSGEKAWELLQQYPAKYTVILLDRMMPGMSGMDVLKRVKGDSRFIHIPIIFQTAMAQTNDVTEGLDAGAFYYITKPYPDTEIFLSIIRSAIEQYQGAVKIRIEMDKTAAAMNMMDHFDLHFRTLDEVISATSLIAKACPDPEKISTGLAELLINAVEHGNADLGYDDKTRFNETGNWTEEVARRLALPDNKGKQVTIHFGRGKSEIRIIITDEGIGFDWNKYLQMDPERIFDNHGRGIAMAGMMSFDLLEYQGCGNEVHAVIYL